ncbi:MAG TPA: O-antigen ligase family protein [Steroidobacteraceae bacterium]|nr:O-antigen ligase family protein [Steroidobacteraceae bacterium]
MRYILAAFIFFLMAAEVFSWDVSMGPGLSIKNAILYLIALVLMFRIAIERQRLQAVPIQLFFAILIAYALVTWLLAGLVIEYPGYDLIKSVIRLKSELIDHLIFFLVFYYGLRSTRDATTVLYALLLAALFANAMTVADVTGLYDVGFQERDSGRSEGALGEPNQYAAFIILFLPGMIAALMLARGVWRLFWLGAVLVSAMALMMTVSRGAFLGLLVAALWGAWLYRHRLSPGKVSAWLLAAAIVVTVAVSLSQYSALLEERLFTQTGSIDLSDASSGRVDIWSAALLRMIAAPVTLLTGYGWDVYRTMPFRYSPHNHYLGLWFNLGLPGLLAGAGLLASAVARARRASEVAERRPRAHLIGYVMGALAVCVAIFFVDLHRPWLDFWAYTGVMMRLAVSVTSEASERMPAATAPVAAPAVDPYGWVARPRPPGAVQS